ncbi:MAG: hypothetical protein JSS14_24445 [Proteobacteria bacterium]|nr:hypothetical protein [Pseudomonadota bacterium]
MSKYADLACHCIQIVIEASIQVVKAFIHSAQFPKYFCLDQRFLGITGIEYH